MARRVYVFAFLPGGTDAVPAGIFDHDAGNRVGTFAYGERYRERAHAFAVDPVDCALSAPILPAMRHDGLYGTFRDASPDWWGRTIAARRLRRDPATLDPIDLLLEGGASRVGALDFREALDAPELAVTLPHLADLDALVAAADDLRHDRDVAPALVELLRQGTSLGGMRPKCVVHDGKTQWIAKFPAAGDSFDQPRVEFATMQLAARAGLDVARTRLHALGDGRAVLLVRRFDRVARDDGTLERRAYASALTLLRADERETATWGYPALADAMRQLAIGGDDLRELFRRMAFNVAVRNTDDHPRNHGVLYDANDARLTPAFDLVPQPATRGVNDDFHLAMTIGDEGRRADRANLLSQAQAFGLDAEEADAIVTGIGEAVRHWRDAFADAGLDAAAQERFAASFARADTFVTRP